MTPFNLFDSLKEYGENDTEILLHSVLEMRRILLQITNGYDIMLKVRTYHLLIIFRFIDFRPALLLE